MVNRPSPPVNYGPSPEGPAAGRSALASELRKLPARLRQTLELRDVVVDTVDIVVTTFVVLGDPEDDRSLEERIASLLSGALSTPGPELSEEFDRELAEVADRLNVITEAELPRWTKRLSGDGQWKRFARKLLGAKSYDRLARALETDVAAIASGLRRIVQIAQPFAVAFDDVMSVLTPEQIKGVDQTFDWATISALRFLLRLDGAVGRYLEAELNWKAFNLDQISVEESDFAEMTGRLRAVAVGPTRERLAELNQRLALKISGAEDALHTSADGVSQAAHSLVELIDRILRTAFSDETVIEWIGKSDRPPDGLIYLTREGISRPTKKAQALCFAYGGRCPEQKSAVHELVATGLVSARSQLQALKHADNGGATEVARVTSLMAAVEGFLTLALRLGWATLDEEEVDRLRQRLAA